MQMAFFGAVFAELIAVYSMSLCCILLMLTNLYFNSNIFCICVFAVVFFFRYARCLLEHFPGAMTCSCIGELC